MQLKHQELTILKAMYSFRVIVLLEIALFLPFLNRLWYQKKRLSKTLILGKSRFPQKNLFYNIDHLKWRLRESEILMEG